MVLEEYTTDIKPVNGMFAAVPHKAESIVNGLHVPERTSEHIVKVMSGEWDGEYAIVSKYGRVWYDDKGGLLNECNVYAYTDLTENVTPINGGVILEIEERPETRNGIYLTELTKDVERANGKIEPLKARVLASKGVPDLEVGDRVALCPKQGLCMSFYDFNLIPQGKEWVFLKDQIFDVILGVLE
jgi:co-chaperonin GroES (HSP10)